MTDNRAEWEQHNCGPGHELPLGRCTVPSCARLRAAIEKALDAREALTRRQDADHLRAAFTGERDYTLATIVGKEIDERAAAAEKRAGGEK